MTSSLVYRNTCSSGRENGTGRFFDATRCTGATRSPKSSSWMTDETSAPTPNCRTASWTTTAARVRATDASTVA